MFPSGRQPTRLDTTGCAGRFRCSNGQHQQVQQTETFVKAHSDRVGEDILNISQPPMVPNTTPTGTSWTAGARMWTLPSTRSPSVFLSMDGRTGSSRSQTQRTAAEIRKRTALSCLPKVPRARTRTSRFVWQSRTGARLTMPSSRVRKGKVIGLFFFEQTAVKGRGARCGTQ
jgi:hypothetical protein